MTEVYLEPCQISKIERVVVKSFRKKHHLRCLRGYLNTPLDDSSHVYSLKLLHVVVGFQKQPLRGVFKKRCSENMQQTYRRTSLPKCVHFGMGVLLLICCIFSEHRFLGAPLGDCFWDFQIVFHETQKCRNRPSKTCTA